MPPPSHQLTASTPQRLQQALDKEKAQATHLFNELRFSEERRRELRGELDASIKAFEQANKKFDALKDSSTDGGRQLEQLRQRETKALEQLRDAQLALQQVQKDAEGTQAQATEAAEKARISEAECQTLAAKLAELSEESTEVAATNRELEKQGEHGLVSSLRALR